MTEQNEQQSSLTITKMIAELVERGELAVVVTVVRGENTGAKLVVDETAQRWEVSAMRSWIRSLWRRR